MSMLIMLTKGKIVQLVFESSFTNLLNTILLLLLYDCKVSHSLFEKVKKLIDFS